MWSISALMQRVSRHAVVWLGLCGALGACAANPPAGTARNALEVGTLVGRDGSVTILATPEGTRYDLRAANGALLGQGLTADEVRARTGQDPRNAMAVIAPWSADEGLPLMLLDERTSP
jgi:hypothetical protein